jgi:hypothetical protein
MDFETARQTIFDNLRANGCPEEIAKRAMTGAKFSEAFVRTAEIAKVVLRHRRAAAGAVFHWQTITPEAAPAPAARPSTDNWFKEAREKAQRIREQIFASADAFKINERTLEIVPVFLTEAEKVAALDAQIRARVDEIGREILGDIINDYIN